MKWEGRRQSNNVEDRRGLRGGGRDAGRGDRECGLDGAWDARDAVEVPRKGVWPTHRLDRRARK